MSKPLRDMNYFFNGVPKLGTLDERQQFICNFRATFLFDTSAEHFNQMRAKKPGQWEHSSRSNDEYVIHLIQSIESSFRTARDQNGEFGSP